MYCVPVGDSRALYEVLDGVLAEHVIALDIHATCTTERLVAGVAQETSCESHAACGDGSCRSTKTPLTPHRWLRHGGPHSSAGVRPVRG